MATSQQYTLSSLEKPSALNEKIRALLKDKPVGTEPKITITGTFSIAKIADPKKMTKVKHEGKYTATKLEVAKVASEWIYATTGKNAVYLRADSTTDAVFEITIP